MKISFRITFLLFLLNLHASNLFGLPIGFGHTQGSLEYDELKDKSFIIYHDRRTPQEARLMLRSFHAAKPHLERWMAVKRDKSLPVIMTAKANGASFANFITDVIELQTGGSGTRDLAWHELTHTIMYRHLDNILGPAGAIIHLAWMPSWFLEGLAESTSVSISSAIQSGFERFHALSGRWPSYESLHSLYSGYTDSFLGYATSGSFVSYLIRRQKLDANLPGLLQDFYSNSQIWMWPWALFPFGPFLPMDDALEEYTNKEGRELWEIYKKAAFDHWKSHKKGEFLFDREGLKLDIGYIHKLQFRKNALYGSYFSGGEIYVGKMEFDPSGWYTKNKKVKRFSDDAEYLGYSKNGRRYYFSSPIKDAEGLQGFRIFKESKGNVTPVVEINGRLIDFFETRKTLAFVIREGENIKLCSIRKKLIKKGKRDGPAKDLLCTVDLKQPRIAQIIGRDFYEKSDLTSTIWISVTEQKIKGNQYSLLRWQPDQLNNEVFMTKTRERISAATSAGGSTWAVMEGTSSYSITKMSSTLSCVGQKNIADIPLQIIGRPDGGMYVRLLHGARDHLLYLKKEELSNLQNCQPVGKHTSPLLYAQFNPQVQLKEAFLQTDTWSKPVQFLASNEDKENLTAQAEASTSDGSAPTPSEAKSIPASARFRPVFAVPWIGGDAGGYNFGILSMPLMDHMQNFTVQLSALYGAESRFPTTQISTYYTGFWPKLQFDAFRYQTWNGVYLQTRTSPLKSAYLDEKGTRITATFNHRNWGTLFEMGMKSSHLKRYIGPAGRTGRLNEPFLTISKSLKFGLWSWSNSISSIAAPEGLNEQFDYNKISLSTSVLRRMTFWSRNHRLSLGLSYGRTRGKKMRRLRESYRPLRIYIPDGGGGLNNISIPVVSGGGLFSATFGDTTARSKIDYSFPLIKSVDTLVRLFYIHELKFSAFVNYGGAWYQKPFPDDPDNRFIAAHGYALDLLFDLKGINFNLGGGTGQVFGEPFEVYLTFGFDQIF